VELKKVEKEDNPESIVSGYRGSINFTHLFDPVYLETIQKKGNDFL